MKSVYIIGSLRNENIPIIGNSLRAAGWDAFDDWYGAGHEADDKWRDYEHIRGRDLKTSVYGYAARHTFEFDTTHLRRCDLAVLVMPAGRSGHLELGWFTGGCGGGPAKPGFILLDGVPDRYDVMWNFATDIFTNKEDLIQGLENYR